jgi:hypothetical protein
LANADLIFHNSKDCFINSSRPEIYCGEFKIKLVSDYNVIGLETYSVEI